MGCLIYTNNPSVLRKLSEVAKVEYADESYRSLLVRVRDAVHRGHRLLTHPLSGSVKPNETPYKSVALSVQTGRLDLESLRLIEEAITACDKFPVKFPEMPQGMREDFQLIDLSLISSALQGNGS